MAWGLIGSVSMVTGWTAGIRFPAGVKDFSAFHCVQNSPKAHPVGARGYFPRGKAAGT
jgi:hypothetical protein